MRFAIIGPPQSGKSTLFSALTAQPPDPAHAGTERLATIDVPDERLDYLFDVYKPKKKVPAHLEFVDMPGISLADAHGQAEFRTRMATVRQCYGIVIVVRAFASDSVAPYRDRIDPKADLDELHTELVFADGGKIFAGLYAMFCGFVLIFSVAIFMTPVFHRFLHHFHLEGRK